MAETQDDKNKMGQGQTDKNPSHTPQKQNEGQTQNRQPQKHPDMRDQSKDTQK